MERDTKNTQLIEDNEVERLYEKLSELQELQNRGWRVNSLMEKIQEQIHSLLSQSKEERLEELRQELKSLNEGTRMSSTNS